MEIRDGRLYRQTHATFEEYCRDRWGFSRQHGYRLITAAAFADECEAAAECNPTGDTPPIPENERQARAARVAELTAKALASLPPEEQAEVIRANEARVMEGAREQARQVGGAQTEANLRSAALAARQLVRRLRKLGGEYSHMTDPAEQLLVAVEAAVAELGG